MHAISINTTVNMSHQLIINVHTTPFHTSTHSHLSHISHPILITGKRQRRISMNSASYDDTDGAAIDTQPPLVLKLPGGAGAGGGGRGRGGYTRIKHETEEDVHMVMAVADHPEGEGDGEEKPRKRGRPKANVDTSPVPKLLISSSGRGYEDAQEPGLGGNKRTKRSREEREEGEGEEEHALSILLPAGKAQVSIVFVLFL